MAKSITDWWILPQLESGDRHSFLRKYDALGTGTDIGATRTRVVLAGMKDGSIDILARFTRNTCDVTDIARLMSDYKELLSINGITAPSDAVVACPGKVEDYSYCKFTNRNLVASSSKIRSFNAIIVNDYFAKGMGVGLMGRRDLLALPHSVKRKKNDCNVVLVAGPGGGHGFSAVYDGIPKASEGSHGEYAPTTETEWELKKYLRKKFGVQPDAEAVASGAGLGHILDFMVKEYNDDKLRRIRNRVRLAVKDDLGYFDPAMAGRMISKLYDSHPELDPVGEIFVNACARLARGIVHAFCAYGGLYEAAGNARRMRSAFQKYFIPTFEGTMKLEDEIMRTPVFLVMSKDIGVLGSAFLAMQDNKNKYLYPA